MKVEQYVMGMFYTNTYLLDIDGDCIVIDPASKAEKMIEIIGDRKLLAILLTHGHFDHIKAVDGLVKEYQCPVYLNVNDLSLTKDKSQGNEFGLNSVPSISEKTIDLKEGLMEIGPFKFEVIFTPGHTEGSVCYKFNEAIFTGDTLFCLSAGRTDLKGGSDNKLKASLRLLKNINENLIVYPGHDEITNLEFEKNNNPYLK